MLELLAGDMPPLVGGMAIGADPITAAILTLAGTQGVPLRGVMIRKDAKQHGTGKFVEGPFLAGEEIVIVEDVVTTGGSSLLAIERAEAVGLKVRRVLAIVDRLEGGKEAFAAKDTKSPTTLFTIRALALIYEPPPAPSPLVGATSTGDPKSPEAAGGSPCEAPGLGEGE